MSGMLRDVREVIRDEHVMRPRIHAAVAAGPRSIPQIAAVIGHPERETVFWVMGMRKYGHLLDAEPDDDGDLRYRAPGADGAEDGAADGAEER